MLPFFSGNSFLVLAVLVFVSVLLLLEALYLMWRSQNGPEARKVNRRLKALAAVHEGSAQARVLKQRMLSELPTLERWVQSLPRVRALDRVILQSGLNWTIPKFLLGSLALALVAWISVVAGLRQSLLFGATAGAVVGCLPLAYVYFRRSQRMHKLERQLPEALDLMTRALQAGHAFSSTLKMAGEEMAEPIAGEFRTVHDEVNFGVSLEQALGHLSERVPLTDLRYFVVAVLIQRDSGGNLTEILGNLSRLIRERLKLLAKVQVLSSEGRMSAWILGLMPFGLAGAMTFVNPEFISLLWKDPIGVAIVKYMLTLMLIGVLIMRKIINVRV